MVSQFSPILFLPNFLVLNSNYWVAWMGFSNSTDTLALPETGNLSAFFANFSFLLLFGAMFAYWVALIFKKKTKNVLPTITLNTGVDFATIPAGLSSELPPRLQAEALAPASNFANTCILFSNLALFLLLALRWQESGHFPLSNLYESLIFLSWSCTTVQIGLIYYYSGRSAFQIQESKTPLNSFESLRGQLTPREFQNNLDGAKNTTIVLGLPTNPNKVGPAKDVIISELLGSVLAPCALFLNAFATFSLPKEMQQAGPLVPALQSNWLMMHVTVMIISYAALMVGSLLAIAFLILSRALALRTSESQVRSMNHEGQESGSASKNLLGAAWSGATMQGALKYSEISENLDYLSYRIIGIGFPFLTIGILSGAVWANEAWGSYWSWDPKETWALLTWFVFAIYLHVRLTKGWEGEKPAILASFGFIVVWICYLGVNLLGEGLHSYGFFQN